MTLKMKRKMEPRRKTGGVRRQRRQEHKARQSGRRKTIAIAGIVAACLVAGGVGLFLGLSGPAQDRPGAAGGGAKPDGGASSASVYDDSFTKYLPENVKRIDVLDFHQARSNPHLGLAVKALLKEVGDFGTWDHKEQGIGVLRRAGITEDAVKSLTLVRAQDARAPVVFMRFAAAPDQNQFVQSLGATASQQQGKTYYAVKDLRLTPLHHVHFLEPTVFVFATDQKLIAPFTEARTPPAVSPDLLQAIKLTRGPRATAALVVKGPPLVSPRTADFFWMFTRAPGSFF